MDIELRCPVAIMLESRVGVFDSLRMNVLSRIYSPPFHFEIGKQLLDLFFLIEKYLEGSYNDHWSIFIGGRELVQRLD